MARTPRQQRVIVFQGDLLFYVKLLASVRNMSVTQYINELIQQDISQNWDMIENISKTCAEYIKEKENAAKNNKKLKNEELDNLLSLLKDEIRKDVNAGSKGSN